MTNFINSVDERTRLAGTNRMELLLFTLGEDAKTGYSEIFGINVFKVREVMTMPNITRAPDMPRAVEGMVSLRGTVVPVINLPEFCGLESDKKPEVLMITEYNKHVQGFMVHAVETIERLGWDEVKAPPSMLANGFDGLVTAIAELSDKRLVMIMDVEKVLAETTKFYEDESIFDGIDSQEKKNVTVLFADDSSVARNQIIKTLDHIGFRYHVAANGVEAWTKLNEIADRAEAAGLPVKDKIQLILTDVEMPEMDGYVLTRKIKADARFDGIPVVMHSSLTSKTNQALGTGVGADAYVSKFLPRELASVLVDVMQMPGSSLTKK